MSNITNHPEIAYTIATGLKFQPFHTSKHFECDCGENVYKGDKYYELSYYTEKGRQVTETFCEECKDELLNRYIEIFREDILKQFEKEY